MQMMSTSSEYIN